MAGDVITAPAAVLGTLFTLTGLGLPLVRRVGARLSAVEQWLAAPLVGALPLAAAILAIGNRSYTPDSMAALLVAAMCLAAALLAVERPGWRLSLPRQPLAGVICVIAAPFVAVAALSAFAPPSDHDTLRYLLTLPRRDLENGRIAIQYGWSVYEFFPPLAGLLTRLVYALGGAAAAQLINVAWMVLAAAWAAALAVRLGGGVTTAALAGLLLLSQRVVVNLAGGVTADFALTGYVAAAATIAVYLVRDPASGRREGILLGLLLGAALNAKYHAAFVGLPLLTVLLADRIARRRAVAPVLWAVAVAGLLFLPLLARNAWVTGNPFFPLLHALFGGDNADLFGGYLATSKTRPYPGGLALAPLSIFINQHAYDGLQFGFPILLIGLPFAFRIQRRARLLCLAVCAAYLVEWWVMMPHLLRFLQPVLGILAALAALGLASAAQASREYRWGRAWLAGLAAATMAVQFAFLGSTALYRLPMAIGLEAPEVRLEGPEFHHYSLFRPCRWIEGHLRPGERYLGLVNAPSFYCPQNVSMQIVAPEEAPAYYTRAGVPAVAPADLAARLEAENVRFVLAARAVGPGDEAFVFAKHRFDATLLPLVATLTPLMEAPSGAVYDGSEVVRALRRRAARPGDQGGE
jgi:4-amino-4-deoxy-L-arabinose transferase-like glycosyltransferase